MLKIETIELILRKAMTAQSNETKTGELRKEKGSRRRVLNSINDMSSKMLKSQRIQ